MTVRTPRYAGFDPDKDHLPSRKERFLDTLREIGVVTAAKRKPNINALRRKYRRDLEELRAIAADYARVEGSDRLRPSVPAPRHEPEERLL